MNGLQLMYLSRHVKAIFSWICLALALLPALAISPSLRLYADDFCTIAVQAGPLDFMTGQFYQWSGRYTSMLSSRLALQTGIAPAVSALLFAAWWIALHRLTKSPALSTLVILVMLAIAPDPFQSYFWLTGQLTYLAPLVLATWIAVTVDKPILCSLLAFLSAGFSDAGALLALTVFGLLALAYRRRFIYPALATGIGLVLVTLAPGNAVRRAYFPTPDLSRSLFAATFAIDDGIRQSWPVVLLLPFAPMLSIRRPKIGLTLALFGSIGAVWLTMFASFYFTSAPAAARVWPLFQYVLLAGVMLCGSFVAPRSL